VSTWASGARGVRPRMPTPTVVAGALTASAVLLVPLATQVLSLTSQVAVAAATLADALFNPMRRRVQRRVDHWLNRADYDADKALAAFGARLQDATDPDAGACRPHRNRAPRPPTRPPCTLAAERAMVTAAVTIGISSS